MDPESVEELVAAGRRLGVTIVVHGLPWCRFLTVPGERTVYVYEGVPAWQQQQMLQRASAELGRLPGSGSVPGSCPSWVRSRDDDADLAAALLDDTQPTLREFDGPPSL